jgi:hypothetical protein
LTRGARNGAAASPAPFTVSRLSCSQKKVKDFFGQFFLVISPLRRQNAPLRGVQPTANGSGCQWRLLAAHRTSLYPRDAIGGEIRSLMSHGSVTMRHGGSVDDRIGVAEERDGLGRTRSVSETTREAEPRSRRKNEANRPTGAPVPLPSLAPFFSALAVLFLQPGTLFPVPPNPRKSQAPSKLGDEGYKTRYLRRNTLDGRRIVVCMDRVQHDRDQPRDLASPEKFEVEF